MKSPPVLQIGLIAALLLGSSQILRAKIHVSTAEELSQSGKQEQPDRKGRGDKSHPADAFSEEIAEQIAQQVAEGFEEHNARHLLSAFDPDAMVGYANFQNQVEAMFQQYDSFRVHCRLTEITSDGDTGVALAELQLEETPRSQDAQPVRKTGQVRFEIRRGKNGLRIIEVKPRSFFS